MFLLNLLKKPMVQEAIRVAGIMGAGDLIAQTVVEKKSLSDVDLKRTLKFSSVGLILVGPTLRIWYAQLEKLVSPHQKPMMRAVKKMSLDQFAFAPFFTVAIISAIGLVNQESPEDIKKRLQSDYVTILMHNYMLWPAAQMINFSIIPLAYQVTFAQFVAIIWNTYMSMVLNKN